MANKIEWVNNWTDPQNGDTGVTVWNNEERANENANSLRKKFGYVVETTTRPKTVYQLPDGRMSDEVF